MQKYRFWVRISTENLTEYWGGGPQANQWGIKKCTYVLVPLCDVPWYHSKVESRKSKVESQKSKVEKKRCYSHFCDVKVDTTLRFPGFHPPIYE
jgi:hypothetical protein